MKNVLKIINKPPKSDDGQTPVVKHSYGKNSITKELERQVTKDLELQQKKYSS